MPQEGGSAESHDSDGNGDILTSPSNRSAEQRRTISYNRIKKFLSDLRSSTFVQKDLEDLKKNAAILETEWQNFCQAQEELSTLATDDTAKQALTDFTTKVNGVYSECKDIFDGEINSLVKAIELSLTPTKKSDKANISEPIIVIDSNDHFPINKSIDIASTPSPQIKLEPIKVPVFNGKRENWVLFRELFTILVHDNKNLGDGIKMNQLYTHLVEDGLSAIRGITPTAGNYQRAWKVLNERYNNNSVLINYHLKRFFNLPILVKDDPSKLTLLIDGVNELVNSLPGLSEPMITWDSILTFCLFNKIDKNTQEMWKNHVKFQQTPTLNDFIQFLDNRVQSSVTANSSLLSNYTPNNNSRQFVKRNVFHVTAQENKCGVCKDSNETHPLYRCNSFRALAVKDRITEARKAQVCQKCLAHHNSKKKCAFEKCPVCSKPHNRLLCYEDEKRRNEKSESAPVTMHLMSNAVDNSSALLGTASFKVLNTLTADNNQLRGLCDTGSQLNLITEEAVKRLKLTRNFTRVRLNGLGGTGAGRALGVATIEFTSIYDGPKITATFSIVQKVTAMLPIRRVEVKSLLERPLNLADKDFDIPGNIDVLIGVTIYADIVLPQARKLEPGLVAQFTKLGWILFGSAKNYPEAKKRSYISAVVTQEPINNETLDSLKQFFAVEEPQEKRYKTKEQTQCEEIFQSTHYRTSNGRYGVRLPMRESIANIGESRAIAKRQFFALESRLNRMPQTKQKYVNFMREYIAMGHMTPIIETDQEEGYYTPHHCVFSSDKFRTVFNASQTTNNGLSLNDSQLVGEKLQTNLSVLLIQFRRNPIALIADIEKMYRQVEVHPQDRKYQKIFWRENSREPLQVYELNTITYGQAAAPHYAIRTLQQCAMDNESEYPIGAKHAKNFFYVDDYLGGGDSIEEVLRIKQELINVLAKGGFELSKWSSNKWAILTEPDAEQNLSNGVLLEDHEIHSILGLYWQPLEDAFKFKLAKIDMKHPWTKRQVLSEIGKLYDPNGFLAPITIIAKIIIQKIWREGGDWDDPVSPSISNTWNEFLGNLNKIHTHTIPRWLGMHSSAKSQLHGFCDASQDAYAAAVYVRTIQPDGKMIVRLIQAKTKVAPLNKPLTIPRLELNAALLLAQLMHTIKKHLINNSKSKLNLAITGAIHKWHYDGLKNIRAN